MDRQVINLIPVLAFVILAGLFAFNSNISIDTVHAEASGAQASLELDSVIDISAPNTVTLNCTPGATDASAELCTSNATVSITTNNVTGYTLQMNAASGSSNALTNTDITPNATIPTLSQAYSSANFPINSWGYTGGLDKSGETGGYNCATNYCPILAYESTASNYAPNHIIKVTNAPANNSTTTLTFAGRVNTTKPSGTYTTYITFTAVANEPPTQPITNGMDMQDIDSEVCGATPFYSESGEVYTVFDEREMENYWHSEEVRKMGYTVAKLEDGNCWMTQNLFLGGPEAITLTPADTNVASDFTLPASVSEGDWDGDPDVPELFDYVSIEYVPSTTKYGNYYNWAAATAGSGTSATTSGDVSYSICPKNWRLPSASSSYTTSEQYNMINNYINSGTWDDDSDPDYPYWYDVTTTDFTSAPVSLVFSGYYYNGVRGQGDYGGWWSATPNVSNDAYDLLTYSDGYVYPRYSSDKCLGYSIRCLVPGV